MSDLVGNPEDRFSRVAAHMTLKIGFYRLEVDIFSMKIYIVVTDVVSDVTYSRKSVNTRVVIRFL